jgi:hypothetical protein
MKPRFYILIIGILLASCQLTVEVDVPDDPPKLVVTSLFSPDSVWQINVSASAPILSQFPPSLLYEPLPVLRDENGILIPLTKGARNTGPANIGGGWNFQASTSPEPGKSYTLEVSALKHPTVFASSVTPLPVEILDAVLDSASMVFNDDNQIVIPLEFTFQDPPGIGDYYYPLMLLKQAYPQRDQITGDTVWYEFETTVMMRPEETSAGFLDFGELVDVINDNNFDGQIHHTVKRYLTLYTSPGFGPGFGHGKILGMRLVLSHSKEEYFKYFRSNRLQSATQGNPFAQPVQVYTNIQNGLGIFAGYTTDDWEFMK